MPISSALPLITNEMVEVDTFNSLAISRMEIFFFIKHSLNRLSYYSKNRYSLKKCELQKNNYHLQAIILKRGMINPLNLILVDC